MYREVINIHLLTRLTNLVFYCLLLSNDTDNVHSDDTMLQQLIDPTQLQLRNNVAQNYTDEVQNL